MSADILTELPARSAVRRPELRPLGQPAPKRRPRMVYGIVAVAGAVAIGAAQMGLSILTTQSSYEVAALTSQAREVTLQQQVLKDEIAGLSSPQFLAANATALGMVIDQSPSYVRLSDGRITGAGEPAASTSSVDALGSSSVANLLVTGTTLVTDPAATLGEGQKVDEELLLNSSTPPAIADGLPTPTTH